ncbi:MAG: lytic transglycosylase domain-containing protein [candidate division Zixibacteria bacterium]|nr:lytic transglycosylase domain-containing protein [candidate division Zixibacteria bacterium]
MIQIEKLGIFLSKPVAVILVGIYLLQSALLVYLVRDKFHLEQQIDFQQKQIGEFEEKLQILNAIEGFQIGFSDDEVRSLTEVIYSESNKYDYDPMFILAVILVESSFKRGQQSEKGAMGLMQMIPYVGEDVAQRAGVVWEGSHTLHDYESSIKLGTLYLFEQIMQFKDVRKALVAYNMGETRLRNLMRAKAPLPKEYFTKVMKNYKMLKETYCS